MRRQETEDKRLREEMLIPYKITYFAYFILVQVIFWTRFYFENSQLEED